MRPPAPAPAPARRPPQERNPPFGDAKKGRRPALRWPILACLGSAAAAFALGRLTAPSHAHAENANPHTTRTVPIGQTQVAVVANPDRDDAALQKPAPDPDAVASTKEAEIIRMLNRFHARDADGLDSELLALVAWINSANEDDLVLFMALGKEILSEKREYQDLILPLAFTRWTKLDAPAAFENYLTLDAADRSHQLAQILFGGWMQQGSPRDVIDHALALQRTMPDDDRSVDNVVGELLRRLLTKDAAQARDIAMEFARSNDPLAQKAAAQTAGPLLTKILQLHGPDAALEWLETWPDTKMREKLRRNVMNKLLDGDMASRTAGMALFAQLPNPDPDTIRLVAQQKTKTDTAEARTWALARPAGEARAVAVQTVFSALANADRIDDAARWLADTPAHPDFDETYSSLAIAVFKSPQDYPAARQWADRVTEPEAAARMHGALIEHWLGLDPEHAARVLGAAMESAVLDNNQ